MKKETKEKMITISFVLICILIFVPLIACGIIDSNAPQTARQVIQIGDEWVELAIDNEGNKKIVARNIDGNWIDVEEDFEGDIQETHANQDIQESIQNAQRQSLKNITGQEIGNNQQQTQQVQTQKSYDQYGKNEKIPMEMYQSILRDYVNAIGTESRSHTNGSAVSTDYASFDGANQIYQHLIDIGVINKNGEYFDYLVLIILGVGGINKFYDSKKELNYKMYADIFKEAASIIRQYKWNANYNGLSKLPDTYNRMHELIKLINKIK